MKTTINGKEIKLVSRNDVLAILSQKVAEMLSNGFIFYFDNGSQGEDGTCVMKLKIRKAI